MAQKNDNNFFQKLKDIDLNEIFGSLNDFKIEDLKNINYKRLFYDIRKSKHTKPILGITFAGLLSVLVLIPKFELLVSTRKKLKQFRKESQNLPFKLSQLKEAKKEFKEVEKIMTDVNNSFLRNNQLVFITQLLNEVALKSNVRLNSFSPILKPDSSKLCKKSTIQKQSKEFKSKQKKQNSSQKGSTLDNFYEVSFSSDYLDILKFLNLVQEYDVTVIPYCLEVESELNITTQISKKDTKNESLIIPLDELGRPINSSYEIDEIKENSKLGKVITRIIFKIPSYTR
ncbi:hypothetical protein HA145_03460 [Prochlorococcus marinus XMU1411]|uniref:hypothetical protein n=1 Tax=Prochlorococcus marinus TaxID=1219 RepID=UPI001ADB95AF|nr:hypothetical protein [Prochlorococcus marinus]MBO8243532.1 hypothetical protein [Prochlorococcus marinus XMU1411]MBW3054646.1 hypothetical protein [Prochlorococcus marinus str. MU1411]MCR8538225.1 hypothetical protein [Prochlorococcus marinus CUG1430]